MQQNAARKHSGMEDKMKLNLEIIRKYLPNTVITKAYNVDARNLPFRRPSLYESGANLETDKLYIMTVSYTHLTLPTMAVV